MCLSRFVPAFARLSTARTGAPRFFDDTLLADLTACTCAHVREAVDRYIGTAWADLTSRKARRRYPQALLGIRKRYGVSAASSLIHPPSTHSALPNLLLERLTLTNLLRQLFEFLLVLIDLNRVERGEEEGDADKKYTPGMIRAYRRWGQNAMSMRVLSRLLYERSLEWLVVWASHCPKNSLWLPRNRRPVITSKARMLEMLRDAGLAFGGSGLISVLSSAS